MEGIQQQIANELMKRGLGVEEATKLAKNVDPRAKNITQILNQITKQRPLPSAPAARGLTAAATALANNPLKMTGIGAGASLVGLGGLALLNTEPEDIGRLIGQGQLAFEDVRDKIGDIADKAGSTYNNIMSRIKSGYDEVVNPPMPDMPELPKRFPVAPPDMPSQPLPEQQMQPMPIIPEQQPPLGRYDIGRYDTSMMTEEEIQRLQEILDSLQEKDPIGFAEGGPAKIAEMLQDINKNPEADFLAEGTPSNLDFLKSYLDLESRDKYNKIPASFGNALESLGGLRSDVGGADKAIITQTPGLADFLASTDIREVLNEYGRVISNLDRQLLKSIIADAQGIDKKNRTLSRLDRILSSGLGKAGKGKQEGVKISEKSVEFLPANMLDMK